MCLYDCEGANIAGVTTRHLEECQDINSKTRITLRGAFSKKRCACAEEHAL